MDNLLSKYKTLKKNIQALGLVIPGRLRTTYLCCGKANCKCKSGKIEDRHGPYIFWDREIRSGLSSASINPKHKKIIEKGIQNRKQLKKLVTQMLKLGEQYATNLKKS